MIIHKTYLQILSTKMCSRIKLHYIKIQFSKTLKMLAFYKVLLVNQFINNKNTSEVFFAFREYEILKILKWETSKAKFFDQKTAKSDERKKKKKKKVLNFCSFVSNQKKKKITWPHEILWSKKVKNGKTQMLTELKSFQKMRWKRKEEMFWTDVNKKLLPKICFIARLLTKMKLPKYFWKW